MTLKDFINLNKDALNSPRFNIEQVVSEVGLGLKGWNKLSNPQRISFIILYCVNSGHKIYYLFRRKNFMGNIYLYIYKKAYTNSFILFFDHLKEQYENSEDLKAEISTRLMADHTEELTSVDWIDRVRKLLEPVEE